MINEETRTFRSSAWADLCLYLRSQVRKSWWNLGSHLTLVASAAALSALFMYIFKDFVGYQLATLEPTWSERGLTVLSFLIAGVVGILSGQWSVTGRGGHDSLIHIMQRVGTAPGEIKNYQRYLLAIAVFISATTTWALVSILQSRIGWLCASAAAVISFLRGSMPLPKDQGDASHVLHIPDWRRHQLVHRSMPGRKLIVLGVLASFMLPAAAYIETHIFLLQITALGCGLTSTLGLIHAVAAELPGTWFEKQAGLTHDQWVKSWQHIANSVALVLAISGGVALLLQSPEVRATDWSLPILAGCLPWLVPSLILQIEGRAKNVNIMVAVLIAVFLGTAMVATPWAAAVLPLLRTQAKSYQHGRFYRA